VETVIFTIAENEIVRIDVADNTLDRSLYMWARAGPYPTTCGPEPIVVGVDRRESATFRSSSWSNFTESRP
jgi:hypothetical protein